MGLEGLLHVVKEFGLGRIIEVFHSQKPFTRCHTLFSQTDGPGLFIHCKIGFSFQVRANLIDLVVKIRRIFRWAGNDEWCPCLINEYAIHLVYYGIVKFPLDHILKGVLHVVSKVVESELVISAVGYIGPIGRLALCILKTVDYYPNIQTEKAIYLSHPLRVTGCQIVINSNHMDPATGKCIQINRHCGH